MPVFRLFFHPPTAAVTQSRARQSAHDPRIIIPRDLLSLTPDSPDRLGGESLNIPQGGCQPWNMTMSCAASFSDHSSQWNRKDNKRDCKTNSSSDTYSAVVCPNFLMCHPSCTVIKASVHPLWLDGVRCIHSRLIPSNKPHTTYKSHREFPRPAELGPCQSS